MSEEGDARSTRQSSSTAAAPRELWPRVRVFGQLAFAGFICAHLALQALRAMGDAARPEPGLETQRWVVALLLVVIWLPFALSAVHQLHRWLSRTPIPKTDPSAHALGFAERLALPVLLVFALAHGAQLAWPLLTGEIAAADVRPELVLSLSSTRHGMPIHAAFYVCGVAAASFYATRQVLALKGAASRPVARAIVALGVLTYALGSFAVIRCSGGQIFP
ncbi:MAG: hypothetical protein ABJB12_07550 [Pseudomonadota bacterium]